MGDHGKSKKRKRSRSASSSSSEDDRPARKRARKDDKKCVAATSNSKSKKADRSKTSKKDREGRKKKDYKNKSKNKKHGDKKKKKKRKRGSSSSSTSSTSSSDEDEEESVSDDPCSPKKLARLDRIAGIYYLDVGNIKRLLQALLTSYDELEDQGYERETVKIVERIISDLKKLFKAIDAGQSVSLEGLTSNAKRKKLRHLFQALRMTTANSQWEKSLVGENVNYWDHVVGVLVAKVGGELRNQYSAKEKLKKDELKRAVSGTSMGSPKAEPSGRVPAEGGALGADAAGDEEENLKGPRQGPARPPRDMVISRKAADDAVPDDFDGQGLAMEGRAASAAEPQKPAWMGDADVPDMLAGIFGGGNKAGGKTDAFEIERTQGELDDFEAAIKEKGKAKSLFEQVRESKTAGVDLKRGRELAEKRMKGEGDLWGAGKHEQEMIGKREMEGVGEDGALTAENKIKTRQLFDPQKDLDTRRQVDSKTFNKMLEGDSVLKGKFGRSTVSSSFL
eukprot:g12047.t1